MASISKRNGKYHVRVRAKGVRTQCKTFSTKADAVSWAREADRAAEKGLIADADCTVYQLLERYQREVSSKKRGRDVEKYRIKTLRTSSLANIHLSKLKPFHIADYKDHRSKKVSGGSVKRELVILSHALSVAMIDWGYNLQGNPCQMIRKPSEGRPRSRRLEGDEYNRLIGSCRQSENPYLAPLVELAIETAMRRGELLSIRWEDVFIDKRIIHLPMTKNGESRDIPLSTRAIDILEGLPKSSSELLFPIHIEALKGLWKRACKRTGIEDLRFHDLRHEATTRFFEKGLNVMEVAAITGHKDLRMLQRYTHLDARKLADCLEWKVREKTAEQFLETLIHHNHKEAKAFNQVDP